MRRGCRVAVDADLGTVPHPSHVQRKSGADEKSRNDQSAMSRPVGALAVATVLVDNGHETRVATFQIAIAAVRRAPDLERAAEAILMRERVQEG